MAGDVPATGRDQADAGRNMNTNSGDVRDIAKQLAEKLGTRIPVTIDIHFWTIPILYALSEKIDSLEERLKNFGNG